MSLDNGRQYFLSSLDVSIIDQVFKWKIISQKSLFKISNYIGSYNAFTKKVRSLVKEGLINSYYIGDKNKYLSLTNEAARRFFNYKEEIIESNSFDHDLILSNFLYSLKDHPNISDIKQAHETEFSDI